MTGDLERLIEAVGYAGLFLIVFAESGLLFGFFLPGDSLLFTAGFLASRGAFQIALLLPLLFVAAVSGDAAGYAFGRRFGRRLFERQATTFFRPGHLKRAEAFFRRHGGTALVVARFLPWVRTFVPIAAGAAAMPYPRFAVFNALGALLWAVGLTLLGYLFGNAVTEADRFIVPALLAIIALASISAFLIHHVRGGRRTPTRV